MIGFGDHEARGLILAGAPIGDDGKSPSIVRANHRQVTSVRGYRDAFNLRPGGKILDRRRCRRTACNGAGHPDGEREQSLFCQMTHPCTACSACSCAVAIIEENIVILLKRAPIGSTMTLSPVAVSVRGLRKKFAMPAVDGIDLTINAGECYGRRGASGAGKTTTLRVMTHFIRDDVELDKVFGIDVLRDPLSAKA